MLIENQIVTLNWHPRNKERLEKLGYIYTGIGTAVDINIKDLSDGSKARVRIICDYCGKEHMVVYKFYTHTHQEGRDCCAECALKKRIETNMVRYGGKSPSCDPNVLKKQRETCWKNYGVEFSSQNPSVREKIKETNLKRYGVDVPAKSPDIMAKMMKSWYENGTAPCSKPQVAVFEILKNLYGESNVFLNYPMFNVTLDCFISLNGVNIAVEYDGKYWHKNRGIQDSRRNYFLIRRGYKVLRIKADDFDTLPSKKDIATAIDYLVKDNHSLAYIDMNV